MHAFLLTFCAAVAGGLALHLLGVPAGPLLGAMLGVALLRASGTEADGLPAAVRVGAFIVIGWEVGQGVTKDVTALLMKSALPILAVVLLLLVFGALLAVVLVRLAPVDGATAFLSTSPGSLSTMTALGAATGANATFVVTVHVLRVTLVTMLAPIFLRLLQQP